MTNKQQQEGGKKKQAKKTSKKGGALVDVGKESGAIFNTSELVKDDHPWNAVVNDPLINALPYMPAPFSTGYANMDSLAGLDPSVRNSILPPLAASATGGAKKGAKKPAAKKDAAPKKKAATPKKDSKKDSKKK